MAGPVSAQVDEHFELYLLFQPAGEFPIPLKKCSWFWTGKADYSQNSSTWSLTSSGKGATAGQDTSTYPTWTSRIQNAQWDPN